VAKQQTKVSSSKTVFGKRRVGKAKKRKSPKDKLTKPYIGQGK
jgi:hypothetical protein